MLSADPVVTRRAVLVGSPVAHSLSPVMHRAAYRACGLTEWTYEALEVPAGDLEITLTLLPAEVVAVSVTAPLKGEALALASSTGAVAERLGAANTLVRSAQGGWTAESTDLVGLQAAISQVPPSALTADGGIVVLGAGATARTALAALGDAGVASITMATRAGVRAETREFAARQGISLRLVDVTHDVEQWWGAAAMVVNCLPVSAIPASNGLLDAVPVSPAAVLVETGYRPWPTPLARVWMRGGGTVVDGLVMLAHQGVAQFEMMTGQAIDPRVMYDAALKARDQDQEWI